MKNTYLINKPQKDGKAALCAVTAAEWLAAVNANRYLPTEHRRYFIADCIEDGKEIDRMIIEVSYAEYKKWNIRHTISDHRQKKPRSKCCNFGRGFLGFATHFLNSFFIWRICSASLSSHSSRVLAYTFRLIRFPSTRSEYLPSYKSSLSFDIQPVPALRIFGLYGSNSGFSVCT